ncbi:hypothetical protein TNIN_146821 [Trichonephila inaurata madagascariensis]|uniref:Uncharacterized protein n=1 Tax=Trichonephila inaurata madagascariensis TaxID=2747483 RepID=A0A8X6YMH9_9ARAC|nr:hypothetical protein TNIN_146821 [Trichonephila inaurata madagascariensis]
MPFLINLIDAGVPKGFPAERNGSLHLPKSFKLVHKRYGNGSSIILRIKGFSRGFLSELFLKQMDKWIQHLQILHPSAILMEMSSPMRVHLS